MPDSNQTGCGPLDELLRGGFANELSLVWGEASTGKTSLMIQTAVQAAIRSKKTLFVDADRSFTPQRLTQIAGSESRSLGEYITLFLPENFAHQTSLIEDLESYMSPRVGLVIFDTITSLYRAALRGDQKPFALNRELTRQLAYLEEFAAAHRIAVVLTSQVHARLKPGLSEIEPVARRTLFHFPRTILRISHTPEASVKTIILERVRGEQARSEVTVRLNQSGFCPIRTHGE